MYYQKIQLQENHFFVVRNKHAIIYFGQKSGQEAEIQTKFPTACLIKNDPLINNVEKQLNEYFNQQLKKLSFPIEFQGTEFQQIIWKGLMQVPYGQTMSYLEFAKMLNMPQKVRPIAHAIGQNSLFAIIPCHRIIGSDQKLHGYRWTIEMKKTLLNLEQETLWLQ